MKRLIFFVCLILALGLYSSASSAQGLESAKKETVKIKNNSNSSYELEKSFGNYFVKFNTISLTKSDIFPYKAELTSKGQRNYEGFIMFNLSKQSITYIQFNREFYLRDVIKHEGKEIALLVDARDPEVHDGGILYFAAYDLNNEQLLSSEWGNPSRCGVSSGFARYKEDTELYILTEYGDCKGAKNVCFYKHDSNEPIYCENGELIKMTGPNEALFFSEILAIKKINLKTGEATIQK